MLYNHCNCFYLVNNALKELSGELTPASVNWLPYLSHVISSQKETSKDWCLFLLQRGRPGPELSEDT